jgi:hypothetical protein
MRFRTFFCLALALAGSAAAHDAYEITTEAWVHPASLDLDVTMAPAAAIAFAERKAQTLAFSPEKFDALRPQLEALGAQLFSISSDGRPLPAPTVTVGLGVENDLELHLKFARPTGTVRVEATHLTLLQSFYGDQFTAHGPHGEFLGQQTLTAEFPVFEFKAPPTEAAPGSPAVSNAKNPAAAAAQAPVAQESRFKPLLAIACAGIAVVLVWLALRRREPSGPTT